MGLPRPAFTALQLFPPSVERKIPFPFVPAKRIRGLVGSTARALTRMPSRSSLLQVRAPARTGAGAAASASRTIATRDTRRAAGRWMARGQCIGSSLLLRVLSDDANVPRCAVSEPPAPRPGMRGVARAAECRRDPPTVDRSPRRPVETTGHLHSFHSAAFGTIEQPGAAAFT